MTQTIQILLVVLLVSAILAVLRLYFVLGDVRQTLNNLEATRSEVSETMKRLEAVAASTEQLLREEVAPTLQVARETLVHVEVMTRALAETTQIARRLAGKADSVVSVQKLLTASAPVAQLVAKRSAGLVGSLLSGVGQGMRSLFSRARNAPAPALEAEKNRKALPGPRSTTNEMIPAAEPDRKLVAPRAGKKR